MTPQTADRVAALAGVGKSFGDVRALADVDLSIAAGETVAVFGPNGSGKTTLVRILATLARPTSGALELFDHDPRRAGAGLRRRIGVVSHEPFLNLSLSPAENLRFYARMYDVPDPDGRIDACLGLVGLEHRRHDPVRGFSRGLLQRCAIARALLHEPELLLLDEAFAGLDADSAERLERILDEERGRRTVLLTSHELARGLRLAERIVVLNRGHVVHDGPRGASSPERSIAALRRLMTTR